MARAVDEVLAVARPGDRLSRFLVDLPAIQDFVGRIPLLRRLDRSIAAVSDNVEDLLMFGRNGFADEERPGNVVVDRMRQLALGPHVHEQKISLSHRQIVIRMRSIVRIRAVRIDGDDGRMPGGQIPALVLLQDEILDFQLGHGNLVCNAAPDFRNDRIHDFPHVLRRIQMCFKLFFAPHRFKDLHQIRGRDDFHPKTPH